MNEHSHFEIWATLVILFVALVAVIYTVDNMDRAYGLRLQAVEGQAKR